MRLEEDIASCSIANDAGTASSIGLAKFTHEVKAASTKRTLKG